MTCRSPSSPTGTAPCAGTSPLSASTGSSQPWLRRPRPECPSPTLLLSCSRSSGSAPSPAVRSTWATNRLTSWGPRPPGCGSPPHPSPGRSRAGRDLGEAAGVDLPRRGPLDPQLRNPGDGEAATRRRLPLQPGGRRTRPVRPHPRDRARDRRGGPPARTVGLAAPDLLGACRQARRRGADRHLRPERRPLPVPPSRSRAGLQPIGLGLGQSRRVRGELRRARPRRPARRGAAVPWTRLFAPGRLRKHVRDRCGGCHLRTRARARRGSAGPGRLRSRSGLGPEQDRQRLPEHRHPHGVQLDRARHLGGDLSSDYSRAVLRVAPLLLALGWPAAGLAATPVPVLTLKAPPATRFGHRIEFVGRLIPVVPGARVRLYRRDTPVTSAPARRDGTFRIPVRLEQPGPFHVAWAGAVSPEVTVRIHPLLNVRLVGTKVVGQPLEVAVRLRPERAGPVRVRVTRDG